MQSLSGGDLPQEKDSGYQFDYAQTELAMRTRLSPFYWTHRDAKFDYACRFCLEVVDRFVYEALEKGHTEAVGMAGARDPTDSNENMLSLTDLPIRPIIPSR